ncbi:MAG: arsenosugar biosynthesis radical SAM protein ArsS [Dethiobacter sp.]|nr:arsenosugar biosynthesis radical SAM protein ArsS [Dethiobacter sp.]
MDINKNNVFELLAGTVYALDVECVQVNLGRMCTLSCYHCHLEASPARLEKMAWNVAQEVLRALEKNSIACVELTGGAPELHPDFKRLVTEFRGLGVDVKVRTNLAVLLEPSLKNLSLFLRKKEVSLAASLPCYLQENVQSQRGDGVFDKSIAAITMLNKLGYGVGGGPSLDLVFNPHGARLPGKQSELEAAYRKELYERYGVLFSRLHTVTNMPIGRFRSFLENHSLTREYLALLRSSFNSRVLNELMCRRQVSVDWDGTLYDCDFNLALGRPLATKPAHVTAFSRTVFARRRIVTGEHCLGCTAGAGSSCRGALEASAI